MELEGLRAWGKFYENGEDAPRVKCKKGCPHTDNDVEDSSIQEVKKKAFMKVMYIEVKVKNRHPTMSPTNRILPPSASPAID